MNKKSISNWLKIVLIMLLVILTVAVRLGNDHQTDFDSYWLHGMAESIQIHHSALWVFHPASLFGFYPMSYPSGTPFFLSVFSELSGISMNQTIFVSSILLGLLITGLVFLLTKELFNSNKIAYLSSLIVSLGATFINYTSFNAAGRIFVMPFALLFFWSLLKWQKERRMSFLFLSGLMFVFALLAHRTGIFLLPILFAFFFAELYRHIPSIWKYIRNHRHYKKHIHPRYEKSKYFLLLDLGILVFFFIGLKIIDLIVRGRFVHNINRVLLTPIETITNSNNFFSIFLIGLGVLLIMGIILTILRFVFKKKPIKSLLTSMHNHYHQIFITPQKYFLHALLIIFLVLFIGQFFGNSFYSPSLGEYEIGLISGDNPLAIFVNFIVNYTTSITGVFIFVIIGFIMLLYKKNKTLGEWTFLFFFISFSGLLLDKRYTRIFLIPFFAIIASFGIIKVFELISNLKKQNWIKFPLKIVYILVILVVVIIGSQTALIRNELIGESSRFSDTSEFWETGQYLRTMGSDFSTITTEELVAGVIIFASSGVPGASHNIYYFVNDKYLQPTPLTFEKIKNQIQNGEKIQSFWTFEDWIFGGRYYLGKHAKYTFEHSFLDRTNQRIISDYNEHFYIHDKSLEKNTFLESIEPVKNVVFDTPQSTIYDIEVGR